MARGTLKRPVRRQPGKPRREDTPPANRARMQVRVVAFAALVALAFVIVVGRLWYLQILTGEDYSLSAQQTFTREVKIPAQRGVIYTSDGEVLANNVPGLNVTVIPDAISEKKMRQLSNILGADTQKVMERYRFGVDNDPYSPILVKENASEPDVVYVSERSEEFPGVAVNDDYVRSYPGENLAANVLGYTGAVTNEELKQNRYEGLPNDAIVGKSGLEYTYEKALSGEPGEKVYNVDARGRVVDESQNPISGDQIVQRPQRIEEPVPGNDLVTTIDMGLQKKAEAELDEAISRARSEGYAAVGGATVALNPENGEVMAMASRPTFDPGLFVGGVNGEKEMEEYEYLTSEGSNSPLTNRAIYGAYPAASTFKIFTGLAGLAYNVIDPYTTVTDDGSCWRPSGVQAGCWQSWREFDGTGTTHGTQNYMEAIMDSNDKYFYQVADWLWNRTDDENLLPKYYQKFGFGKETGIDLPSESAGRIPTKEWQQQAGSTPEDKFWSVGRWVNMAIGQGDVLVTPMQLARGYAAVYNGGTLVTPHVGKAIKSPDGGTVKKISPSPSGEVKLTPTQLQSTKEGLAMVTQDGGTAESVFADSSLRVMGKTGTGQTGEDRHTVAWFAGWVDNPQGKPLVVVTMVEEGGGGEGTAAPAVRDILEYYYGAGQNGSGNSQGNDNGSRQASVATGRGGE